MKGINRCVTLEGLNLERLIHQAGEKGMYLEKVRRKGRKLHAVIGEEQLPLLQQLAEAGGWRMTVGRRVGAGRMADMLKRRLMLLIGFALAAGAAIAASQLMWRTGIVDGGVYEPDILAFLTEEGIVPFRWKASVDTGMLRDALEWRYPRVAWFEVGWRGGTLEIRVAEGVAPGETASLDGVCDVTASRSGIVDSIVTIAGTPAVKQGDIVQKGQVLIKGEERTAQGEMRPVAARGIVLARVWDAASVVVPATERQTVYTGRKHESVEVSLPWFRLWKSKPSGFEQEDISVRKVQLGGVFFPLEISYRTHQEARVSLVMRDSETVKGEAGVAALRKLRQKVGVDDDFVDKWVDYSMIDSEQVCAVAYAERVIDIARTQRDQVQ